MLGLSRLSFVLILFALACDDDAAASDAGRDAAPPEIDAGPADAALDAAGIDAATTDAATLDAALADAATLDAATLDAGCTVDCPIELLRRAGCFEIVTAGDVEVHRFGEAGTEYGTIVIELDLELGDWRRDLFSRTNPLNHITFGLSRVASVSRERYILGMAPQVNPSVMGLARRTIFFGRVDLEARPSGMGFMAYTSFRASYAWRPMNDYHVRATLDAVSAVQVIEISQDGALVQTIRGDIPYMSPSLTSSRWDLELGGPETDGREVSPVGWRLCNTVVTATLAP